MPSRQHLFRPPSSVPLPTRCARLNVALRYQTSFPLFGVPAHCMLALSVVVVCSCSTVDKYLPEAISLPVPSATCLIYQAPYPTKSAHTHQDYQSCIRQPTTSRQDDDAAP